MSDLDDTGAQWRREIDGERRKVGRRDCDQSQLDPNSINRRLREVEQQQIAMAAQQRAMIESAARRDARLDHMDAKIDMLGDQLEGIGRDIGSARAFLRGVAWVGGSALAAWAFIGDWLKRQLVGA